MAVIADTPLMFDRTLSNGLRLIVRTEHRAPVVVSSIWYRVGGSDEHWGNTGLSHFLEHMMFKGTRANPNGRFSEMVAEVGGDENAMTSNDFTAYYQRVNAKYLPMMLQLEADRMQNLRFDDNDFKHELAVVKEERRLRVDDQPSSLMMERFSAVANLPGPYIHGAIGWPSDLNHMTREAVLAWYRRWYVPNNAIIVVVGDVDPEQVWHWVQRYFGSIPRRPVNRLRPYHGHAPWGSRSIEVKARSQVPMMVMGYAVPVLNTAKDPVAPWALSMIESVLGNGQDSGRLAKHLIHGKQMLTMAMASYDATQRGNAQMTVFAIPSKGHTLAEAQRGVENEIADLKAKPVSEAELKRFKRVAIAQTIYQRDSSMWEAMVIGQLAVVGLPIKWLDEWADHLQSVRSQDIQQVAQRWLQPDGQTIARLYPRPRS